MAARHCDTENDSEIENNTDSNAEDDDSLKILPSSKRGREEEEKCSPDLKEESKKLKKIAFHWSWSDECTILKNFYEFSGKNGSYSKDFYHFVKNKLSVEVSNSQLSDRVYRLRKRFLKDKCKMENGEMKFPNTNSEKLFEMSSNIWGSNNQNQNQNQSGGNQWKPEAVDRFYGELFRNFVEQMRIDIACIPPHILKDIKKDWEEMKIAKDEFELKNVKLLVEVSDIRCSQNKS